jgi:PEGA domain
MALSRPKDASRSQGTKQPSRSKKGGVMTIQYLLVTYPDQRAVLADGTGVGFTNHTLMLPADEYVITLDADGFQPASQNVVLAGTSIVKPMVIAFARTAPKAV